MSQDIEVELTLLPTEHGGRNHPVSSGYRPQFYYRGDDWDAVHTYIGVVEVRPGDTVTAQLRFLNRHAHVGRILSGMPFLIREGNRVVGYGRVVRVLDPESAELSGGSV